MKQGAGRGESVLSSGNVFALIRENTFPVQHPREEQSMPTMCFLHTRCR